MVKFSDIVQLRTGGCSKCFSIIYTLPCVLNVELAEYLESFGLPIYPLASVKLLRIDAPGGYHIEGRIGTKTIKFVLPKKFEKVAFDKISKKIEFESKLSDWMTDTLNIDIIL